MKVVEVEKTRNGKWPPGAQYLHLFTLMAWASGSPTTPSGPPIPSPGNVKLLSYGITSRVRDF